MTLPRGSGQAKLGVRAVFPRRAGALLVALGLVATMGTPLGCQRDALDPGVGSSSALPISASARPPERLPPLQAPAALVELEPRSSGGRPALWLGVPLGARQPRPLVLLQQDISDDAQRLCRGLSRLGQGGAFVLCQSSKQLSPFEARRQLRAGLKQTKRRFGRHVSSGDVLLVAVSESSWHSSALVREEPAFFSHVLLVSKSMQGWSAATSSLFARRGGKRIVFACANPGCFDAAVNRATLVKRSGGEARALHYDGDWDEQGILRLVQAQWSWLASGDARFSSSGPGDDP